MDAGFSINEIFDKVGQAIESKGNELRSAMSNIGNDGQISDQQMLKLQFQVNIYIYNVLLETVSTITKSLTDEAKQLVQRAA